MEGKENLLSVPADFVHLSCQAYPCLLFRVNLL